MINIRIPVIWPTDVHAPPYLELDPDAIVAASGILARVEALEREMRQHYHLAGGEPASTGVAPGLQPEVEVEARAAGTYGGHIPYLWRRFRQDHRRQQRRSAECGP